MNKNQISNKNEAKKFKENNQMNNKPPSGVVKVTVGNKLLEMEQNEKKVVKLEKIIQDQESKIQILNKGVEPYTIEIEKLKSQIISYQKENSELKSKIIELNKTIDDLNNRTSDETVIKNELIESNKKLQKKVEFLSQKINEFKYETEKDQEEYNNMCRVKSNYETRVIQLSEELEKNRIKLQTSENIINQKEKYIQMLINKKNSSYYSNKNKEQEKQDSQINSKRYPRPQSFGMKNKNILGKKNYEIIGNDPNINALVFEQEKIIKKLKEKISHLEKDNAGLIIRLKNNNIKSIKK